MAFVAHGFSYVLLSSLWRVRGVRWVAWLSNYIFLVRMLEPIDRILGLASRYPCN